jgi:hypothetical protein
MGRVWGRIAVAAVSVTVVLGLVNCKLRPTAGGKCTANGKYVCSDTASAMLCQGGTYVSMPCRGPRGCTGLGSSSACDDDLAQEKDACLQTLNENYACSVDHTKELVCGKDGIFVLASTCKGPKKCAVESLTSTINCDDSFADVNDPCVVGAGDANYACSSDKKTEVVCKPAADGNGKFEASNTCRGMKGCRVENETVYCDQSAGREGDLCRPVDNYTCSEDGTVQLKCSAQFKWAKNRDCKKNGCKIKGTDVECW